MTITVLRFNVMFTKEKSEICVFNSASDKKKLNWNEVEVVGAVPVSVPQVAALDVIKL